MPKESTQEEKNETFADGASTELGLSVLESDKNFTLTDWFLRQSMKPIYVGYMQQINPGLVWNEQLSQEAYKLAGARYKKLAGPYFSIYTAIWHKNWLPLEQHVLSALYGGFSSWYIKIKGLDKGTPFGCSQRIANVPDDADYVQVLCIFKVL
ncbi:hypothetical protein OSTOST_05633 [Ostertagia ostertagi]